MSVPAAVPLARVATPAQGANMGAPTSRPAADAELPGDRRVRAGLVGYRKLLEKARQEAIAVDRRTHGVLELNVAVRRPLVLAVLGIDIAAVIASIWLPALRLAPAWLALAAFSGVVVFGLVDTVLSLLRWVRNRRRGGAAPATVFWDTWARALVSRLRASGYDKSTIKYLQKQNAYQAKLDLDLLKLTAAVVTATVAVTKSRTFLAEVWGGLLRWAHVLPATSVKALSGSPPPVLSPLLPLAPEELEIIALTAAVALSFVLVITRRATALQHVDAAVEYYIDPPEIVPPSVGHIQLRQLNEDTRRLVDAGFPVPAPAPAPVQAPVQETMAPQSVGSRKQPYPIPIFGMAAVAIVVTTLLLTGRHHTPRPPDAGL